MEELKIIHTHTHTQILQTGQPNLRRNSNTEAVNRKQKC